MDYPQTGHPHGHHYREDPHSVGLHSGTEGEGDEHHHEKKSVLKKVKDKARKIKDTITKHGHGQNQDEQGQEFDEEDDEDEEMVEEPVVQDGPIYASTVIRSRTIPMEELYSGQSGPHLERTTAMKEGPLVPKDRTTTAPFPSQAPGKEDTSRQYGDNLGRPTAMEDHPYSPDNTHQTCSFQPSTTTLDEHVKEGNPEKSGVNLGASLGLEEDPNAPKDRPEAFDPPNYQIKVADPTGDGGEEVGITPIISSFDKMSVQDKPEQQFTTGTGSHDQFSPEPLPTEAKTTEDTQDTNNAEKPSNQSTYTGKISTAASAITDKAVSAKNTVASKLGYGGSDRREEMHEGGDQTAKTASVTEYGKNIANRMTETLSPAYGKVAEAGSAVMSKLQGTGPEREGPKENDKGSEQEGYRAPDKGVSVKTYLAEKLKPSDEDRALSAVISDALHKRREEPRPMGKVTDSEEVARRLGTEKKPAGEGCDSGDVKFDSSSNVSSGSGVVDKLRGAVSSWFGKGGDSQAPPQSIGNEGFPISGNAGERQGKEVAENKRI